MPVLLLVLGLAGAAFLTAVPAAAYDCIETEKLRLIYPGRALHFIAPYSAQCFENSARFYRRLFDYEQQEKVNLILDDAADFGNAAVWGSPRNSMLVHIAPVNFVYETGPSNERINFAMNHEMAHVVTLDQAAGRDAFFRGLFGGKVRETSQNPETLVYGFLTMPRRAAPRWHREGTAVFFETWMAGGLGRAQGPYDEMVFRSMVRDSSRFYEPLGLESEGTKIDFQAGVNAYLYGTRFMTWLAWRDSPEKLLDWVARRPGSRPYFASQFRHVYGRSLTDAWREWVEWEHEFQRANLQKVREHPLTPWRDLSPRALGSVSPAEVDLDTGTLYVAVNYPGTVAYVAAIPLDGGPIRDLEEVKGPALYSVCSLAYDPDRRMLYYTTDNNDWRDLCALDPATGRSRVILKDARIGDLAYARQDSSLWGVRHFNGVSTLVRLPYPHVEWQQVHSFPYGRDVYDVDLSADGTLLSASMAEISGRQTLRLFQVSELLQGRSESRSLFDFGSSVPASFVFSPDGRYLYGSSYYTGVSNIFRYDLSADSMEVVTNAETGFFRPVPVGGDSLVVFRYSGSGFVPAMVEAEPRSDLSAITFLGQQLVEKHPVLASWTVPSPQTVDLDSLTTYEGPYRAFRSFGLATIYPVVEGYKATTTVGLRANFSDPFSLHDADLTATYAPDDVVPADERWHVKLGYRHRRWTAGFRYNPASFYDLVGPTKTSRKGYGANLAYERTLLYDQPRTMELTAELAGFAGLEKLPEAQNISITPGFDVLGSASLDLHYSNLRASLGAVDQEKGHQWRLEAWMNAVRFERRDHAWWRGFPLVAGSVDLGAPLPIPNSSAWLRTAAGYSPGDPEEPFANFFFGGFGNNWVDHQDPKRYRRYESFPGVEIDDVGGTNFARALVDWNLPPLRFREAGVLDLFATWARTSLFASGLVTNLDDADSRRRLANVGVQTDVRLQLLIQQPLTLSVGYARAFERHVRSSEEWMFSLKVL